jgi:oligosaccharyltransferase complex subunit alpha (ribophorin I)
MALVAVWVALAVLVSGAILSLDKSVTFRSNTEKVRVELLLSEPVSSFVLPLTQGEFRRLSYAILTPDPKQSSYKEFRVLDNPPRNAPKDFVYLEVKGLEPTEKLSLRLGFVHPTRAYPSTVKDGEPILVKYEGNVLFLSLEPIEKLQSVFDLGTSDIKSFGAADGSQGSKAGQKVSFSASNLSPLSFLAADFHFKAEHSFITVTKLVKEFEVSHWGNVAVTESFEISNTAANYTGSWSRLDYSRRVSRNNAFSFDSVRLKLPKNSHNIHFRDYLGNISTSTVRRTRNEINLDLMPRFPLVPSWKTDFYVSYDVPSAEVLKLDSKTGKYLLTSQFGCSIPFAVVEELIVRVILPEGASDAADSLPFAVDENSHSFRYTYLDTIGRPMLEFKKKNAGTLHNKNFEVFVLVAASLDIARFRTTFPQE